MRSAIVVILLIIAVLCSSAAFAGDEVGDIFTMELLNGRGWLAWSESSRSAYVLGVLNGLRSGSNMVFVRKNKESEADFAKSVDDFDKSYLPRATVAEIQKGIDLIYADPANVNVPVIAALEIFEMRVDGRPQTEIDKRMEADRKLAHDGLKEKARAKH